MLIERLGDSQVLEEIDLNEIADQNVMDYFCTSGGQLCIWDDGTASMLYGSHPSERCLVSLGSADCGHEMKKRHLRDNKGYYTEMLRDEIERLIGMELEGE